MPNRNQIELVSIKNASDPLSGAALYFDNSSPLNQVKRAAGNYFSNDTVAGIPVDSTEHETNVVVSGTRLKRNLNACDGHEWDIWARPEEKNPNVYFGDDYD